MTASIDDRRLIDFAASEHRHFDHVTSHSLQGLTSERVMVNMDTNVHPELISQRFAYVSVSRASHDAQVFTNDAATLAENFVRDVSKASAIKFGKGQTFDPQLAPEQSRTSTTVSAAGFGLAL